MIEATNRTTSSGSTRLMAKLAIGIESVAEDLAEREAEADEDEQADPGEDPDPPLAVDQMVPALGDHGPELRRRRAHAEAEKAEPSDGQNGVGDAQRACACARRARTGRCGGAGFAAGRRRARARRRRLARAQRRTSLRTTRRTTDAHDADGEDRRQAPARWPGQRPCRGSGPGRPGSRRARGDHVSVMPPTSPMNEPTTSPISAPPATAPTPGQRQARSVRKQASTSRPTRRCPKGCAALGTHSTSTRLTGTPFCGRQRAGQGGEDEQRDADQDRSHARRAGGAPAPAHPSGGRRVAVMSRDSFLPAARRVELLGQLGGSRHTAWRGSSLALGRERRRLADAPAGCRAAGTASGASEIGSPREADEDRLDRRAGGCADARAREPRRAPVQPRAGRPCRDRSAPDRIAFTTRTP